MIETLPFERMFASAVEQKVVAHEQGSVNTPPTLAVNLSHQQQIHASGLTSEPHVVSQAQQQQQ